MLKLIRRLWAFVNLEEENQPYYGSSLDKLLVNNEYHGS